MGMKFFHLPKSKQFKMGTRFYDPHQEAMQESQERFNQGWSSSKDEKTGSYGTGIKGSFRNPGNRIHNKMVEEARSKSNTRLIYTLIILMALFYFFLK